MLWWLRYIHRKIKALGTPIGREKAVHFRGSSYSVAFLVKIGYSGGGNVTGILGGDDREEHRGSPVAT